jgi:hypothetical protein
MALYVNDNVPKWSACNECWKHKTLYVKSSVIFILIALIIFLSIPNKYAAQAKIADETKEMELIIGLDNYSSWIKQIAPKYDKMGDPDIYAKILKTKSFVEEISGVDLANYEMDYFHYFEKYEKKSWLVSLYNKITLSGNKEEEKENILDGIQDNIEYKVSSKTGIVTLQVTDSNPLVAAMLVDSIRVRLQKKLIVYKLGKAKMDLANAKNNRIYAEKAYHSAFRKFAQYSDSHFDSNIAEVNLMKDKLEKESELTFNMYSKSCVDYVRAEAFCQKYVPSFSLLSNVTVPYKPIKPNLMAYILAYLFISMVFTSWWVLYQRTKKERQLQ